MAEINYEKNLVRRPVYGLGGGVKGRQSPVMTYMSNDLVPGCNMYIELGWIYDVPEPNPHILEHSHNYDDFVLYIGGDPNDDRELGGEIQYYIGGQPFTFDKTASIYAPRGVKHGPAIWKKVTRPHLEMTMVVGGGNTREAWASGTGRQEKVLPKKTDNVDYGKYFIREPFVYLDSGRTREGARSPIMQYICDNLIPGINMYLDYVWIYEVPEPHIFEHAHDYDEVVLHIGIDPDNPEDLGAEVEFIVDGQKLTFNTTSAIYVPKGVEHGPLTWKKVTRPHIQMPIIVGAGTLALAGPAGFKG